MTTDVRRTRSTFQRSDEERSPISSSQSTCASVSSQNHDDPRESNWVCSHCKRICLAKFQCCDQFWPCHRCHNNRGTCGGRKLKSRDTELLKCVHCKHQQQVPKFYAAKILSLSKSCKKTADMCVPPMRKFYYM